MRDGFEVDHQSLDLVTFYARNLGVPERRNIDDLRFCAASRCSMTSAAPLPHAEIRHRAAERPARAKLSTDLAPHTDLLLHDMGPGLADNRPGRARDRVGMENAAAVGHWPDAAGFRPQRISARRAGAFVAREAVLWHGGEAQASRDAVVALPKDDRDAILAFLESL